MNAPQFQSVITYFGIYSIVYFMWLLEIVDDIEYVNLLCNANYIIC